MLPASDWIEHFVRMSGKSVTASASMTPQAWNAWSPTCLAPIAVAHGAAGAVGADHVLRAHDAFLALALARGVERA